MVFVFTETWQRSIKGLQNISDRNVKTTAAQNKIILDKAIKLA